MTLKKNHLIILQARSSSNRLPGKVLKKINGIPLVVLCVKRLKNQGSKVIVATSKEKSDDKLVKLLIKENKLFRGSLKDVFSRYLSIAKKYNDDDLILRATADNPLPDGNLVNTILIILIKLKIIILELIINYIICLKE